MEGVGAAGVASGGSDAEGSRREHPDILISIGNLANTYRRQLQGRRKEAEELAPQVLEKCNKVFSDNINHPDTCTLATAAWVARACTDRQAPLWTLMWPCLEHSHCEHYVGSDAS